jgi:uncharacterized protein
LGYIFCGFAALSAATPVLVPPMPERYVLDQAAVLTHVSESSLNARLERYERETSTQILIALLPRVPEGAALEDFCVKVYDAWKPGKKGIDNGLIIFAFIDSHRLWIQTGYGVEAKMPDSVCRRICDLAIAPEFKKSNFAGGLSAGLDAIEAALRGEYKGTGHTVSDFVMPHISWPLVILGLVLIVIVLVWLSRIGRMYGSGGIVDIFDVIFRILFYVLQSGSGGGFSNGGGGGGFKGGGGRTGGGGAGGQW